MCAYLTPQKNNLKEHLSFNNLCKGVVPDELGIKQLVEIFKPEIILELEGGGQRLWNLESNSLL